MFREFRRQHTDCVIQDYAQEYIRLSLLGVNNINSLKECTKVLPPSTGSWSPREDPVKLNSWLGGGFVQDFSLALEIAKLDPKSTTPKPDASLDPSANDAPVLQMESNPETAQVDKLAQQKEAQAQGQQFQQTPDNTPSTA